MKRLPQHGVARSAWAYEYLSKGVTTLKGLLRFSHQGSQIKRLPGTQHRDPDFHDLLA